MNTHPYLAAMTALVLMLTGVSMATTDTLHRKDDISSGAKPCSIESLKRPYVLFTAERLAQLRDEIKHPGWKQDYYRDKVMANADLWLGRSFAIPPRSGHFHNFVCSDGQRLPVPPGQILGQYGPYTCPACGKKWEGEKFDGAKRNIEHGWICTATRDLALAYALGGDKRYAEKSAQTLLKLADAYPGRHTSATEGGLFYQSLDESMNIIPLCQAYDLICDAGVLTPEQKDHIEHELFLECAAGLRVMGIGGNWGSWHLSAVGVIGLTTKHQGLIDFAFKSFKSQISEQLGEDGLWPESVHTYHFFPLYAFLQYAEASTNAGTDLYSYQPAPGKGLHSMLVAPISYMYPNLQLPAINDGWYAAYMPQEQYDIGYYRYHDPAMAWVVNEFVKHNYNTSAGMAVRDRIWSFIDGSPEPVDAPMPEIRSHNFPVLGISILRTSEPLERQTMMTFDYGRFLGHGQPDKMGVTLFSQNRVICADYGTPSYGSALLPYYTGTSSHNTLIVDGQNQKRTTDSRLLAFNPDIRLSCSATDQAYPGVDWRRTVYLGPEFGLVVDDVKSTQPHTFDFFLHSEGDLTIAGNDWQSTPTDFSYKYVSDVRSREQKEPLRAEWKWKDGGMVLAAPGGTTLITGRVPAENATRTIRLVVMRKKASAARFVAVLAPYGKVNGTSSPAALTATTEGDDIIVNKDGTRTILTLTDMVFSINKGPMVTVKPLTPAGLEEPK